MSLFKQAIYKEFESEVINSFEKKSNLLVVTVPGMGVTRFIKDFIEQNKYLECKIITEENNTLRDLNFLDFDFDTQPDATKISDGYFRLANPSQKFVLILNKPKLLNDEDFKNSFSRRHLYSTFYFRARSKEETFASVKEINKGLEKAEAEKIYGLSGGIMRIVKYLSINPSYLNLNIENIVEDSEFKNILKPTIEAVTETDEELLEKMNIKKNGHFISSIINTFNIKLSENRIVNIVINEDLSFAEDNKPSDMKLLKVEKDLLDVLRNNNNLITKEQIADIKWGIGSYDEYSDQAIGKTVQRLRKKLKEYTFAVIPNVGYKLVKT